ncbi:MAG: hypothetical protein O2960_26085 [Verrucomicrobia bacterium]|nr:hypothetical protein [Verrucomicrobiota bacterium]
MKVLFDQGVPKPLRLHLPGNDVTTAYQLRWAQKKNGESLSLAVAEGFELFVTTDQNLRHQQKLVGLKMSVFIPGSGNWPEISPYAQEIAARLNGIRNPGVYHFAIPPEK